MSNMSIEAALARIAALEAALTAKASAKLSMKVTDKGGASLYGLGRFPVTLYASQWDALLNNVDMVRAFVDTNRHLMTTKD